MTSEKSIFRLPHKLEFNSLFLWIATAGFFSFALVHLFLSQANLDASWLLHAAWRITNGERLYIDIFESNPPLAVYFNLPAVFLARLLDISEITTFYIFLFSLIVLSLILTWKFLGLIYNKNNKLIRNAIFIVILFVTLILVFGNYGQREHLAFIFTLPYVYLVCARSLGIAVSRPLAIFIGLLAGIGMAFKPFFLLVWLFLECYLTFIARRGASYKRIENLPILTFNVLYAGLTLWSFPEYMAMLSLIRKYYFAYNNSVIEILINGNTFSLWIMAAVAMILFELEPQDNQVTRILFLTASAYLISALLQRKGWLNHMYPSQAFLYILLFTILLRTVEISPDLQRHIRGGLTSLVMILTAGLMLYTSYWIVDYKEGYDRSSMKGLVPLVRKYAYKKPIYVITADLYPTFPLVNYSGAQVPYHFHQLWILPGIVRLQKSMQDSGKMPSGEVKADEQFLLNTVINDLQQNPPAIIIVDIRNWNIGFDGKFNFLKYFMSDSRFANFFKKYSLIARNREFLIYRYK